MGRKEVNKGKEGSQQREGRKITKGRKEDYKGMEGRLLKEGRKMTIDGMKDYQRKEESQPWEGTI